jgi:hypothetical protein
VAATGAKNPRLAPFDRGLTWPAGGISTHSLAGGVRAGASASASASASAAASGAVGTTGQASAGLGGGTVSSSSALLDHIRERRQMAAHGDLGVALPASHRTPAVASAGARPGGGVAMGRRFGLGVRRKAAVAFGAEEEAHVLALPPPRTALRPSPTTARPPPTALPPPPAAAIPPSRAADAHGAVVDLTGDASEGREASEGVGVGVGVGAGAGVGVGVEAARGVRDELMAELCAYLTAQHGAAPTAAIVEHFHHSQVRRERVCFLPCTGRLQACTIRAASRATPEVSRPLWRRAWEIVEASRHSLADTARARRRHRIRQSSERCCGRWRHSSATWASGSCARSLCDCSAALGGRSGTLQQRQINAIPVEYHTVCVDNVERSWIQCGAVCLTQPMWEQPLLSRTGLRIEAGVADRTKPGVYRSPARQRIERQPLWVEGVQ